MALRAFKATFLVAIDEDEAVANEQRGKLAGQVTVEELKEYLNEALQVDWDNESEGDPCGIQSVEVNIEGLTELTPAEVKTTYGDD